MRHLDHNPRRVVAALVLILALCAGSLVRQARHKGLRPEIRIKRVARLPTTAIIVRIPHILSLPRSPARTAIVPTRSFLKTLIP